MDLHHGVSTGPPPQRSSRELAVIQAGRAIELRDDRRQLNSEAPLASSTAGSLEFVAPPVPPGRHESGQRLDNEHRIAAPGSSEKALHHSVALRVRQLVERERCDERRWLPGSWPLDGGDVSPAGSSLQSEERVGPRGFGERPMMAIDSDE